MMCVGACDVRNGSSHAGGWSSTGDISANVKNPAEAYVHVCFGDDHNVYLNAN